MALALADHFVWDSWYVRNDDVWHSYYLKAPHLIGDPELRHWNVSFGHATSTDLVTWNHHGTCFEPSAGPAWDDYTTWTGSTVRGDDGHWHLYYTGASRGEDGKYQRIGHAISDDLHNWERVGDGMILDLKGPNAHHYETDYPNTWHDRAMRDPWVMKDPGGGWTMHFTARVSGVDEANAAGCIGLATSPDGYTWTLEPPAFAGGYGQLEVPQVFEAGGRWYCLFCTAAEHHSRDLAESIPGGPVTGSHYLIGAGPHGPWAVAPGFLDGALPSRRYAARILDVGAGLALIGFADRPEGRFLGHIMDPEPVLQGKDGLLRMASNQKAAE